jgi:hypothetical protein
VNTSIEASHKKWTRQQKGEIEKKIIFIKEKRESEKGEGGWK